MNQAGAVGGCSTNENEATARSAFVSLPTASHQQSHHQHHHNQHHNQQQQQHHQQQQQQQQHLQLQPTTTMSGINASHLAAIAAAGSHPYAPVDQHSTAAFMMSNAAATIAAVAASAVQQMNQANANNNAKAPTPPGTTSSLSGVLGTNNNTLTTSSAVLPSAFYHAALQQQQQQQQQQQGNHHQQHQQQALLTALANVGAGQPVSAPLQQQQQAIASPTSVPGLIQQQQHHVDADANANANTITYASSMLRPNAPVLSQPTSTLASPALLSDMQSWSLGQLDRHISLLHQMNQPVPHSVAILRSESDRKTKKKNDKRVANRKSASNSRARKKALVDEMTKTNARLKKQAMILALLPDLVITTTTEGEITFCSAQAERILQYKTDDLSGGKLYNLLVPSSRHALKSLIEDLVHPGKAKAARASARRGTKRTMTNKRNSNNGGNNNNNNNSTSKNITDESTTTNRNSNASARDSSRGSGGGNSTDDTSGAVAIVSEQSFPLSVVEVENKTKQQSSLDSSTSNSGCSGEDDGPATLLSTETKNLRANNNLDRNVRWHNQRMLEGNKKNETDNGPKDDVTGASVTANNASARLSSLEHCPNASFTKENDESTPYESTGDQSSSDDSLLTGVEEKKKNEDASDDSGYRESNDSREESSSSWSDTSRSNDHRKKPLAPTCRMCLIRDDLTTVWCEVTSSIRNKSSDEDTGDEKATNSESTESSDGVSGIKIDQELLLCLRPIRNGKKVDESLRFVPLTNHQFPTTSTSPGDCTEAWVSASSYSADTSKEEKGDSDRTLTKDNSNNSSEASLKQELNKKRPPKKRPLVTGVDSYNDAPPTEKRTKHDNTANGPNASETEKSVVESLMFLNKSSQ